MRIAEITMIRIFRDRKHSGKGFLLIIFKTEVELRNRLTIHCSPFALHPLTVHRSPAFAQGFGWQAVHLSSTFAQGFG